MATTFFYLEAPGEREVLQWFRSLPEPPDEAQVNGFVVLHFGDAGELVLDEARRIDATQSPVITIVEPERERTALWTVGEVRFLAQHMRSRFPALDQVQKRFAKWLGSNPVVWDQRKSETEGFGHFLKGGIKNVADKVYALPSGFAAYEAGRYFVGHQENEIALDRICKSLRLRGVECA